MFRKIEKKLNKRVIDILVAGTTIDTKNMSPEGQSFFNKLKNFFRSGLKQMKKDLNKNQLKLLDKTNKQKKKRWRL